MFEWDVFKVISFWVENLYENILTLFWLAKNMIIKAVTPTDV